MTLSHDQEVVSDETLQELLVDGLIHHRVTPDELLDRISSGSLLWKSDDFDISSDFPAMVFRYLLAMDRSNQLNHIVEIFSRGSVDKTFVRKARVALAILADEAWYKPLLDAWTSSDHKVQRNLEMAFEFPHKQGRGSFKRSLAARLEKQVVDHYRQKLMDVLFKTPGSVGFLDGPEFYDTFLDMALSDKRAVKRAGIISLANYVTPFVEELTEEMVNNRDELNQSIRTQALWTLLQLNPGKGIHFFWRELKRDECEIELKLILAVMAMILTCMNAEARYRWMSAAIHSPNMSIRGCSILCINLEPEKKWIEPLLDCYTREDESEIKDLILAILKLFYDSRIGEFLKLQVIADYSDEMFELLNKKYPEQLTPAAILQSLQRGGWKARRYAIKAIGRLCHPEWIPILREHCRDYDNDVRSPAILELAKYDAPFVFQELVYALLDESESVSKMAEKILVSVNGEPVTIYEWDGITLHESGFPVVERMRARGIDPWQEACRLKDSIEQVFKWGERFGKAVLGLETKIIRLVDGLGKTCMNIPHRAEIEVTLDPIVNQHRNGTQIVEALILHEIGHHMYDNLQTKGLKSVMGQVKAEGLDELFSILQDERLERRLRACWPEYQPHIDRLNSYAFAEQTTELPLSAYAEVLNLDASTLKQQIASGQRAGTLAEIDEEKGQMVMLKPADLMALPGAMEPLNAFLTSLIGGFDPRLYHDPRLSEAMRLMPANFKDLDHGGMLRVARSIRNLLDIPDPGRQGDGSSSLSPQAKQAMAEAVRQLLDRLKSLHAGLQSVVSDLKVPSELLEAAERGNLPSLPEVGEGVGEDRVQQSPRGNESIKQPGGKGLNLGNGAGFDEIEIEAMHEFDSQAHAALVISIRKHIRALRAYFEQLGLRVSEETGVRQGRRLDTGRARLLPATGNPNMMIRRFDVEQANAYLGIVIDKSGSMCGEEMDRAKSFATLITESAKGIHGLAGDIGAFDDDTYYHLGSLQRAAISSLEAGGGNNDAGGLARAAERALASGKVHKLLVMISDGSPTECSVEALADLVQRLHRDYGIVCVQVAVDRIEHEAFPDFIDLTTCEFHEAVARFGKMVRQHTRHWR